MIEKRVPIRIKIGNTELAAHVCGAKQGKYVMQIDDGYGSLYSRNDKMQALLRGIYGDATDAQQEIKTDDTKATSEKTSDSIWDGWF